ncbi:MAG: hypothetical protein WCJ33_00995 [Pseudomonadota bacterium]
MNEAKEYGEIMSLAVIKYDELSEVRRAGINRERYEAMTEGDKKMYAAGHLPTDAEVAAVDAEIERLFPDRSNYTPGI